MQMNTIISNRGNCYEENTAGGVTEGRQGKVPLYEGGQGSPLEEVAFG